jgi:hypothetical protein
MSLRLLPCVLAVTLLGCPGGDGAIGDHCSGHGACSSNLQCLGSVCVPRCESAPECGDGYHCDSRGICQLSTGQPGDACDAEADCAAGLSCQIEKSSGSDGYLLGSCVGDTAGRPPGSECTLDQDCRNGTCDLGHCVDLCSDTLDCAAGMACTGIPRVSANGQMYRGCLPARGTVTWSIPVQGTNDVVGLPIPENAVGVSVEFAIEDQSQMVGATTLVSPTGVSMIEPNGASYYENDWVRHRPEYGQSVLAMPSTPTTPLEAGVYSLRVRSLRIGPPDDMGNPTFPNGTATPTMTAVIKVGSSVILDLHFHFLDFTDHPCAQEFAGRLDASVAQNATFFQTTFLSRLKTIFQQGGIALGTMSYTDLKNHPDLDGLDIANARSLLALGSHSTGINVFFVRTLSPVGIQAFGPNPGPAGLANTPHSGVVIALDTLCYRSWNDLARIAAHEIALYMGLYNNVEVDPLERLVQHADPIPDSDTSSTNLMFYSELGGTDLSEGQRYVLRRNPVLR